jgi:phage-related protein
MDRIREIVYFRHYFGAIYNTQTLKVKEKIDFVLFVISHVEIVPEKFLKHIEGQKGLYEIRIETGNNIFRIFCCFDKGKIIVLFNGFIKKSRKTPKGELETALTLKDEYFQSQ